MKKFGFTMVEMIVVIVVMGILSAGTFVSLKHLYQRTAKSKTLSNLSNDSQIIVDQIAALMYDRVPSAVWGYEENVTNKETIYNIVSGDYRIVEWYGVASESLKAGHYSGFVDMDDSDGNRTLRTYNINGSDINATLQKKFGLIRSIQNSLGVVFAGAFDTGNDVNISSIDSIETGSIVLNQKPQEIYEKYYLVDSAYAIARGDDISCSDTNETDTLYLIYNYRPWMGNSICDGNATILSRETKAFEVGLVNNSIYFNLTLSHHIKGIDKNITISKQKVVF